LITVINYFSKLVTDYYYNTDTEYLLTDDVSRNGATGGDVRDTFVHCIRKACTSVITLTDSTTEFDRIVSLY